MPAPPTIVPGRIYHVFNRGVNRNRIFFEQRNYAHFLRLIRRYFIPQYVEIIAYCLMPTHYHIALLAHTADLGRAVMQPFGTAYTKAINKARGRVGSLFQGKYKAHLVATDSHLRNLVRYIHRNPVDAHNVENLADWPWSSYREYIGLLDGNLVRSQIVLRGFASPRSYQSTVEEGEYEDPDSFYRWLLELEE